MKSFLKILILICLFSVSSVFAKGEVIGYFQTSQGSMPNTALLDNLTHVILFQVYPGVNGNGLVLDWFKTNGLSNFVTAAHNKGVKVIVAVGGANGATANFPGATDNAQKRTNFANAIKNLVNQYNLDGVDLDWEPTQPVAASTWQNYLDLLLAFKTAMPDKRISATLGADSPSKTSVTPLYGNHFPNDVTVRANFQRDIWKIDAVQIMTYDMCTGGCVPGWSGSGANAGPSQQVLDSWAAFGQGQLGFDKEKIFIGVHSIQDDKTSAEQKINSAYQGGFGGAILWEFSNDNNTHLTWIADKTRSINGGKLGGGTTNPTLFTVTFNPNGGSVTPSSATQTSQGGSISIPTPTRSGYDFNGWFTAANGGTKINGSTYTPSGNITIYAQWTQKITTRHNVPGNIHACEYSYLTQINTNGWEGNREQCETGGNIGYTVAGSYAEYLINVNGTGTYKIKMKTALDGNAQTITITGGGANGTITAPAGTDWTTYKDTETNIQLNNGNQTLKITTNGEINFKDISIEKVVAPTIYQVTFNTDGGSTVATQNIESGKTAARPANNPTKNGYTFDNWYSNFQKTTLFNFSSAITANTTIYAKWTENPKYTVTMNPNGTGASVNPTSVTQASFGASVTLPTPTRNGYTFVGWNTAANGNGNNVGSPYTPTGNITLFAKWTQNAPVMYKVTFNVDGGSTVDEQNIESGKTASYPKNPTKEGYEFDDWYSNSQKTTLFNFNSAITKNTTIYAKWNIVNYTINYTLNNGTVNPANPTSYNIETNTITLANPTRAGYTFTGWTGSNGSTPQTNVTIAKGSTGNKNYTANWTVVSPETYTITASVSGGNGNISPAGITTKNRGENQEYTFTPNTNFIVNKVLVNGMEVTPTNNKYTISNITENKTIVVSFKSSGEEEGECSKLLNFADWKAQFSSWAEVTIGMKITENNKIYRVIVPAFAYGISPAEIGGEQGWADEGDCGGTEITTHTITASVSGGNGTISPNGENEYVKNSTPEYTFTPDNGYEIDEVRVDGEIVEIDDNSYTFDEITQNHTILVSFKPISDITGILTFGIINENGNIYAIDNNGNEINSGDEVIAYESQGQYGNEYYEFALTAIPDAGYRVKEWKINGEIVTDNSDNILIVTFENYDELEISVEFELDKETAIHNEEKSDSEMLLKSNVVSDKMEIILDGKISFAIYDMTGNIVATGNEKIWNLQNQNGRFVANGTYLVVVETKTANGKISQYSTKLGVKR